MPPPFPGMDPWLEDALIWPDVHNSLIAAIRDDLGPLLRPRYYVALEERTYVAEADDLVLIGRPDVTVGARTPARPDGGGDPPRGARSLLVELPAADEVKETYLAIRAAGEGAAVTVIEILSPGNKRPGQGRDLYEAKRRQVLGTRTSLVEIDLLRGGERSRVLHLDRDSDYRILVARGVSRPFAELMLFGVRDPIDPFPVPLLPGEEEPRVDLGALLTSVYDRASYDLRVDDRTEPDPPLAGPDRDWAERLLRDAGRRS